MSDRKPCPNLGLNNAFCTCPYKDCARHGICCECIGYHLPKKQLPQCYVQAGVTAK